MLSLVHATSGAFVAVKLGHPLFYIPVALGLHYLEDWIPHWDVGTGLSNGTRTKQTALLLELIDLVLSASLIFFLWQQGQPFNYHIWLGAFFGLLPDFLEAPRNFLGFEPAFLKRINNFHGKFHHSIPHMFYGLAPQAVTLLAIGFLR